MTAQAELQASQRRIIADAFGDDVQQAVQAIAVEVADYSKRSFEDSTAAMEKLLGAKTLEKAIEVQSDYFKTAYEGFVSEATKITDLCSDLAKETYKPLEGFLAKTNGGA